MATKKNPDTPARKRGRPRKTQPEPSRVAEEAPSYGGTSHPSDQPTVLPTKVEEAVLHPKDENGATRHTPQAFKMGRNWVQQSSPTEQSILASLLNVPPSLPLPDDLSTQITQNLPPCVNPYALTAYLQAAQQVLYNQSYLAHNEDTNSGYLREESSKLPGMFTGHILTTLNDLCRLGFGSKDPTTKERRAMRQAIEYAHHCPVTIRYPQGVTHTLTLSAKMDVYKRESDNATAFHLVLNPIFCGKQVVCNFGEFPQDATRRLRLGAEAVGIRMNSPIMRLMQFLGIQDKRRSFTCTLDNLAAHLGLREALKINLSRTLNQIRSYFEILKRVRLLRTDIPVNPIESKEEDKLLTFTFYLDKDFCKPLD